MTIEKIEKNLKERFAAPLRDCYLRRIIFWHDPDGAFAEMLDEINIPDVQLLKLNGTNNFAAKMLLSETDMENNYLVYNPISYADTRENWLLDIEYYSEEFRADLVSMRMEALHMADTLRMRKAVKLYSRFFDNKERTAKLISFGSDYSAPGQLHIDVLAVLAGTQTNTIHGIIRRLLTDGLDANENAALANIRKFGSETVLREILVRYTGYTAAEEISLYDLAAHILLTASSVGMKKESFSGLRHLISELHQSFCYSLIHEWQHSENDETLYEIACEVEERFQLAKHFAALEVTELLEEECLPCIDVCIIRQFLSEISENVIRTEEILSAAEKRRTAKWYKKVSHYYDGLFYAAKMQQFYQAHITGFHAASYAQLWQEYSETLYLMDTWYRKFHLAFGRSLRESDSELDDLFKSAADVMEHLYKNWYLSELTEQWTKLTQAALSCNAELAGIPQQLNFYKNKAEPIISAGSRVYVIISDALRYETAAELTQRLIQETNGAAKISAMQSVFPSVTKFGMAALLPHKELHLTSDRKLLCDGMSADGTLLCDGMSADGTANREKILKKYGAGNVAVTYKELLSMKQAQRREAVSGAYAVYIYHNTIDAVGDKIATEDQVFDACEAAVEELKNLVKLIVNTLSGSNILITADHGFLYSYKPLEEYDKAEKSLIHGEMLELDRRYMIADDASQADYMQQIPLEHLGCRYKGYTPASNIRIKKQGGGMNYVHGGISLQECAVPVIEFKNLRASSKNFVDIKKAEIQLISQSRKISNSIFSLDFYQKEPAGGKIVPAIYEIYVGDEMGRILSDIQTIIADRSSTNSSERVFHARFSMKNMAYRKTEYYYLTVMEKETSHVLEHIEFTIDIAFANDFDI